MQSEGREDEGSVSPPDGELRECNNNVLRTRCGVMVADFVAKLCEQNYVSERRSVEERGDGRVLHITYYRCTIMELLGYGSYTIHKSERCIGCRNLHETRSIEYLDKTLLLEGIGRRQVLY